MKAGQGSAIEAQPIIALRSLTHPSCPAGRLEGCPGRRLLGYRPYGSSMALSAQERTRQEGARAALLMGSHHDPMDTLSHGMVPCLACRLVARPQIVPGRYPHALQSSWTPRSRGRCDPFPRNGCKARDEESRPPGL
jgi:hypothetical protein